MTTIVIAQNNFTKCRVLSIQIQNLITKYATPRQTTVPSVSNPIKQYKIPIKVNDFLQKARIAKERLNRKIAISKSIKILRSVFA